MFGNLHNPTIPGLTNVGISPDRSGAVLHIFPPRPFRDQVKRPMVYQFNDSFIEQADVALQRSIQTKNNSDIAGLIGSPYAVGTMIPTASASHVLETSRLSYNSTFMLTVDNDRSLRHDGSYNTISPNAQNRVIYYGYFIDEPINMNMGHTTVNEQAALIITHKTVVNRLIGFQYNGSTTRDDTQADIDIIPQMVGHISRVPTHMMRPEDLINNTVVDSNNQYIASVGDYNTIKNEGNPQILNSKLVIPNHNIRKILTSIADTNAQMFGNDLNGTLGGSFDIFGDVYSTNLTNHLRDTPGGMHLGLDAHKLYTLGAIMSRYDPTIHPVGLGGIATMYDTIDQSVTSANTIFSSLICSILPSIMSNCALLGIAFSYDSPTGSMQFTEPPESIMVTTESDLIARAHAVINMLKNEIFPILRQHRGEFQIHCRCSYNALTQCTIKFYDDSDKLTPIFEVPTILGGINNCLVGNADAMQHNVIEFGGLVRALTDNNDIAVPLTLAEEQRLQQQQNVLGHNQAPFPGPYTHQPTPPSFVIPGSESNMGQPVRLKIPGLD